MQSEFFSAEKSVATDVFNYDSNSDGSYEHNWRLLYLMRIKLQQKYYRVNKIVIEPFELLLFPITH